MKIEFEFEDDIVQEGLPLDGVAVLAVLDDSGHQRYVTGFLGDIDDAKAFGLFGFGFEVAKVDLIEGLERGEPDGD